ncbi:family 1 glycosyltransferase [Phakopsora pachyrhizi]|nr:family 1 glycosyltransferase [Phakopsora pachyrhizi]
MFFEVDPRPANGLELKRFTCLTIGTRGDVQPYIALCQRLQEDGHTCTIATHKVFEGLIKGYGIGFAEIAGDPAELIKHCIEHGMLSISFWWKGYHRFKDWFAGLTQSAWVACQNTDVLIESPSTFVGVHIAQSKGIDYIRAFTMPWTKTTEYPHAFAVPPYDLGGWYNKFSYKVFDYVIWKALSSPINAWRKADLSLAKTSLSKLNIERIPFLYNFSPKIVPKASDWGENTVVTGYWFTKPKSGEIEELDHELQRAIKKAKNEDKKVVYIGFGSVIVPDPGKVTDAVTGALEENKNIFAVVSGGWTSNDNEAESSMLNAFRKYKDSIYYVKSVPHESLFPKIDAALHHGGAGTTAASMRAGIYTMIHPFFGAQRVESLRIGKHVKALTMKDIDLALKEVLKISSENSNSKSIGEDIRNEDGVSVAAKAIYKVSGVKT